jgi:hypothetical protein
MAIEIPCAKSALAQLEHEVLQAIREIATAAKTSLLALKAQKEALLVSLDISLIPLQVQKQALDSLIETARSNSKIIPTDLVLACPQLGSINTTLEAALLGQLEGVQNLVFDIDRLISEKNITNAQISQFQTGADFLDAIIAAIDDILSEV